MANFGPGDVAAHHLSGRSQWAGHQMSGFAGNGTFLSVGSAAVDSNAGSIAAQQHEAMSLPLVEGQPRQSSITDLLGLTMPEYLGLVPSGQVLPPGYGIAAGVAAQQQPVSYAYAPAPLFVGASAPPGNEFDSAVGVDNGGPYHSVAPTMLSFPPSFPAQSGSLDKALEAALAVTWAPGATSSYPRPTDSYGRDQRDESRNGQGLPQETPATTPDVAGAGEIAAGPTPPEAPKSTTTTATAGEASKRKRRKPYPPGPVSREISAKLQRALGIKRDDDDEFVKVQNQSHLHDVPENSELHFKLTCVSSKFEVGDPLSVLVVCFLFFFVVACEKLTPAGVFRTCRCWRGGDWSGREWGK
jgi:hypothetical protein